MNREQEMIWDALCELSGEDVMRLFTDYYGTQLLDYDFQQFLEEEGVLYFV